MVDSRNPFYVKPPDILGALVGGFDAYGEAKNKATLAEAAPLLKAGDYKGAVERLVAGGNMQAAAAVAQMENSNAMRQFQLGEAQRQQSNWQQTHQLQREQANKPTYKTIKHPDGSEEIFEIRPGQTPRPVTGEGAGGAGTGYQPKNPFAQGKMTGEQGKVATYLDRLDEADTILRSHEDINKGTAGALGGSIARGPLGDTLAWSLVASPERKQVQQAQRNFVNAILRRESGAVISDAEFKNAALQYFPQPNDDDQTIANKKANRLAAMKGYAREAGHSYTPPPTLIQKVTVRPGPGSAAAGQPGTAPAPQGGAQAAPAPQGPPVRVKSMEEAMALPPNTLFITPDGRLKVRP